MLGWLRATQGDRIVSHFRTRQMCRLVAYLAYYCHRSHPRGELIELLWPERPDETGRRNLRVALTLLRHQLEPPGVPAGPAPPANPSTPPFAPAARPTAVGDFPASPHSAAPPAGP